MIQKRQCCSCRSSFTCHGECKQEYRTKCYDYCSCPNCVKGKMDAYLSCETRYGKDAEFLIKEKLTREKVEFT